MTDTLAEDLWIFMIMLRSVPLRMENVSDKICEEDQDTLYV